MTITPVPDYKAALADRLQSSVALSMWCLREHIVQRLVNVNSGKPANWIALVAAGGIADVYLPWLQARVDIHIYGSTGFEAMRGWRIVKAELDPTNRKGGGFTALGCLVTNVSCGLPIELDDGEWPRRVCSVVLSVRETPVTA